jgi:hypothetical protein|tara:strand:+ start:10191 stop:10391 length:201 start_codon:yes stop_codon:yes gene_type:complete
VRLRQRGLTSVQSDPGSRAVAFKRGRRRGEPSVFRAQFLVLEKKMSVSYWAYVGRVLDDGLVNREA